MERRVKSDPIPPVGRDMRMVYGLIAVLAVVAVFALGARWLDRAFNGPEPETVASASLESMRAQNRLVPFVANFVSVTTSKTSRFGFTSERTLILPGTVRYELDLSKLQQRDLSFDKATNTLTVQLPEIEVAGPEADLSRAREYGAGGVLSALTDSDDRLNQANRRAAQADLLKQARSTVPMNLARNAARDAVERSFAMPLAAAGIEGVTVVARFPTDGVRDGERITGSVPYAEAIEDARRRGVLKERK